MYHASVKVGVDYFRVTVLWKKSPHFFQIRHRRDNPMLRLRDNVLTVAIHFVQYLLTPETNEFWAVPTP